MGADMRVIGQIDPGGLHRALPAWISASACLRADGGIVVILLADRLDGDQFPVTVSPVADGRHIRFRPCKLRSGAGVSCRIGGRIELIEYVSGLDIRAFPEKSLLENAADLRPDLGDEIR
jgi:hypothetical protein